jgi:hypothetical protein
MIEQTEFIVTEWHYHEPVNFPEKETKISNTTSLEVMKKRAGVKKGIACRFTCRFITDTETILEDKIDKKELIRMIDNCYSKFKEKFDLRKFGTVLQNRSLTPLNENSIDLDAILPLLE